MSGEKLFFYVKYKLRLHHNSRPVSASFRLTRRTLCCVEGCYIARGRQTNVSQNQFRRDLLTETNTNFRSLITKRITTKLLTSAYNDQMKAFDKLEIYLVSYVCITKVFYDFYLKQINLVGIAHNLHGHVTCSAVVRS